MEVGFMRRYFKYLVLVIVSIFLFDVEAMEYNTYDRSFRFDGPHREQFL